MNKISAVLIAKNEAANLPRCLESIAWVDEIVLVDSGSIDETVEIARSYGCRIVETPWLGFGPTKQLAVREADNDWILSVDADEVVSDALRLQIQSLKDIDYAGYRIKRSTFYLDKKIRYSGWQGDYPLRLFNRSYGTFNDRIVHESVELQGRTGRINAELLHYSYPTIRSHIDKMTRYAELSARQMSEAGRRSSPFTAIVKGAFKFFSMYVLKLGFLDGIYGLMLARNSAFGVYLKYVMLWSLNRSG